MNTSTRTTKHLTAREFFRSPAKVAELVLRGKHIVVTKRGKEVFEVVPKHEHTGKTAADFADLQISAPGTDTNLSKHIDEVAYGR